MSKHSYVRSIKGDERSVPSSSIEVTPRSWVRGKFDASCSDSTQVSPFKVRTFSIEALPELEAPNHTDQSMGRWQYWGIPLQGSYEDGICTLLQW